MTEDRSNYVRDEEYDWTLDAKCLDQPVNWWLAEEGSRKGEVTPIMRRALFMCARCPVQRECLEDELHWEGKSFSLRGMGEMPVLVEPMPMAIRAGTFAAEREKTKHLDKESRIEWLLGLATARYSKLGMIERQEEAS